jgi:hypothetical protein
MNLFEMFEQGPPKPTLIDALRDFLPIAVEHLNLDHIPKIRLVKSLEDTTFGRYVDNEQVIYVVVDNRNPVDILRTLAHEMVHYAQGQDDQLDSTSGETGSPIENEANAEAGVIMREFNEQFPQYLQSSSVQLAESQRLDAKCWKGYKKQGTKMKGDVRVNNCVPLEETYEGDEFFEAYGELWYNEDEQLDEAEYHGHKVPLGKPMQGDVKKFKVYVKDPSTGNIKKVNFGDPNMRIKKSNPARRKSFRARHNCANPGPRTSARYWSCRKW